MVSSLDLINPLVVENIKLKAEENYLKIWYQVPIKGKTHQLIPGPVSSITSLEQARAFHRVGIRLEQNDLDLSNHPIQMIYRSTFHQSATRASLRQILQHPGAGTLPWRESLHHHHLYSARDQFYKTVLQRGDRTV